MTHPTDQIETYLTGGLAPDERQAFEAHMQMCAECADALSDARAADVAMNALFAGEHPSADFEDRMIQALSSPQSWLNRPIVHPMVRRAAVGIAASLMIAGIGYLVNRGMSEGTLPGFAYLETGRREAVQARASSHLKNIAAAMLTYTNGYSAWRTDGSLSVQQGTQGSPPDNNSSALAFTGKHTWLASRYPAAVNQSVEELKRQAINLTKQEKYNEALGVVDQIHQADPNDDYANGVRPMLEDKWQFQQQRNTADLGEKSAGKPSLQWSESTKYDDILRYPAGWPDAKGAAAPAKDRAKSEKPAQAAAGGVPFNDTLYTSPGGVAGKPVAGGTAQLPNDSLDSHLLPTNDNLAYAFSDGEKLAADQKKNVDAYYASAGAGAALGDQSGGNPPTATASETLVMQLRGGLSAPTTVLGSNGKAGNAAADLPAFGRPTLKAAVVSNGAFDSEARFDPAAFAARKYERQDESFAGQVIAESKPGAEHAAPSQQSQGQRSTEQSIGQAGDKAKIPQAGEEKEVGEKDQKLVQLNSADVRDDAAIKVARADVKAPTSDAKSDRSVDTTPPALPPVPEAAPSATPPSVPAPEQAPARTNVPPAARPKIIRTGDMDFEVENFESAVSTITKVVEEEGGYISTTNSDKLPNGKVKGTVVLRVTPERLDTLVLKLRGIGDLKTQNIRAQDITKEYTDLESRLRAAQIMCDQILDIIKSGKAQVKDLLEAEKQLGVYREKVEQLTGEINYFANQISLSTLTLTLFERDIRTPALASEVETVTMTLVTENVDEAAIKARDAIAAAKGRVVSSQQAQTDEGQSTAAIKAQVPPDAAEEVIAKLKQIQGQLDHFDRQRSQTTSNGSSPVDAHTTDPVKVKREDVTIDLTLYNLARLTPRRSTSLSLAATDVDEAKHSLEEQVRSAGGRIIDSRTEYPRPDVKQGTVAFDVPTEKADALIATLKGLGEMLQISTIENPNGQGVTESKRGFAATIYDMAGVQPRRQTTLTLITQSVDQTQTDLADKIKAAGGRVIARKLEHPTPDQSVGTLAFELPGSKAEMFLLALKADGESVQVNTSDNAAAQNVTDSKRGFQMTLIDLASVMPRRTTSLTVVTKAVDTAETDLVEQVRKAGGRIISRKIDHPAPDQSIGNLAFEVPADKADAFLLSLKQAGETLGVATADNTGAPIVTDAKRGFNVVLRSLTTFKAREVEQVTLASANVKDAFNDLRGLVHTQGGRVLTEHLNEDDSSNSLGQLEFEISREAAPAFEQQLAKDGQVVTRLADRLSDTDSTIDSKVYVRLTISSAEQLPARQVSTLGVEVNDVQRAMDDLSAASLSAGGRQVDNPAITQNAGLTTATVQYDVPLEQIQPLVDKVDAMGLRKTRQTLIDTHAPDGKLARARLTVTFETPATLSTADDGLWAGVRRGLVTSLRVLSYSLTMIIIGLCVVVPFGLVIWAAWRGVKWSRKSSQAASAMTGTGAAE